jgi:protein-disulfide isomerase
MFAIGRRGLIVGAGALALGASVGACNGGGAAGAAEGEMALGNANAPVTLVEYASTTCPHCAEFHETAFEQLKTNYIDTGRIRFVFREFPTPPPAVAVAGFQLARCGGASPEQYFTRIGELFRQQTAIFATGSMEGVRAKLIEIGGAAGLSEQQVLECIGDEAGAERVRQHVEAGESDGVTGTPTFVINGTKYEGAPTYEDLARALDAAGA